MFIYLFDRQGRPVSKDALINILWPDMPLDKANTLFHTTLSYVRKSLAEQNLSDLIQSKISGYQIDFDSIDSDYNRLLEAYQKIQAGRFEDIGRAVRLVELYKTAYFENISSEWVISKREHLERIFIICCR
jgi:two-component SAPR family response regulator